MARGTTQVSYVQEGGENYRVGIPCGSYDFLYTVAGSKDPRWNIGDRVVLPDGREFRYAKSASAITTNLGCVFTAAGYTAYTAAGVAAEIGDRSMTVPAATHATLTEDELRGGYVVLGSGGSTVQVRQIVGNAAAAANAAFVIYLDAPLTVAVVVASTGVETFQNPFAAIGQGVDVAAPKAGVAATGVSGSGKYFWVQTKGWTFIAPQSGITGKQVGACWRHDGSLDTLDNGIEDSEFVTAQFAGFRVLGTADGNGPLFYLQG